MSAQTLVADPAAIRLDHYISTSEAIILVVEAVQQNPACPSCGEPSASLHSRYVRRLADLPWHDVAVQLELHVRKLRCRNQLCEQKVFCERLPNVAAALARKTVRLNEALTLLAFALGGEAGARTAGGLRMTVSGDTLLRRLRRAPSPTYPTPGVLGVDDWAKRKGQRYGTILVDLERRRPVELLPDREAETFAAWLRSHPGVQIISRDRGGAYADGARQGAPTAIQIADRFHLIKNISEAFACVIQRHYKEVRAAARLVAPPSPPKAPPSTEPVERVVPETASEYVRSRLERERRQRFHAPRKANYEQVKELQRQGYSIIQVVKHLALSYGVVANFFRADTYPAILRKRRGSSLERFDAYLRARWKQGCQSAQRLHREICEQGFRGSSVTVRRHVQLWRAAPAEFGTEAALPALLPPAQKIMIPTPRSCAWLLLKDEDKVKEEDVNLRRAVLAASPRIARGRELVLAFREILRGRQVEKLSAWVEQSVESGLIELANFAKFLGRDEEAVRAAATHEWSNGQVEGQINRLKFLKRQMFGRANFDLLRARVLYQPAA